MLKSYKNHRILKNSAKPSDFMSPRGAVAILLSRVQGTNPLQKTPRGHHARTAVRRRPEHVRLNGVGGASRPARVCCGGGLPGGGPLPGGDGAIPDHCVAES